MKYGIQLYIIDDDFYNDLVDLYQIRVFESTYIYGRPYNWFNTNGRVILKILNTNSNNMKYS